MSGLILTHPEQRHGEQLRPPGWVVFFPHFLMKMWRVFFAGKMNPAVLVVPVTIPCGQPGDFGECPTSLTRVAPPTPPLPSRVKTAALGRADFGEISYFVPGENPRSTKSPPKNSPGFQQLLTSPENPKWGSRTTLGSLTRGWIHF